MAQRQEMQKYGIDFGRELIDLLRNPSCRYKIKEKLEDARWLERELTEASQLLEERGEFNPQTVLQMQILVKLNGILSKKYSSQLNSESGRK